MVTYLGSLLPGLGVRVRWMNTSSPSCTPKFREFELPQTCEWLQNPALVGLWNTGLKALAISACPSVSEKIKGNMPFREFSNIKNFITKLGGMALIVLFA